MEHKKFAVVGAGDLSPGDRFYLVGDGKKTIHEFMSKDHGSGKVNVQTVTKLKKISEEKQVVFLRKANDENNDT